MAACAAVLAAGFLGFARGWIGGGDVKLAAASALWLGFDHLFDYLIYASLLGGALTLLIMMFRLMPLPGAVANWRWAERLHQPDAGIPYGIALAAAALVVYSQSEWMVRLAG
jgi:prepilin peptidase CpaA